MDKHDDILVYEYAFKFPNSKEINFVIKLERDTLNIIHEKEDKMPDWARLENFKCPHCPLSPQEMKYCPVAVNLVKLIPPFMNLPSYEDVGVIVKGPTRNYYKKTSLQQGVSPMLGLMMVSSGCPIMGKLKPMLFFHLPFASLDETQIRALSMFLLSQWVKWKKGDNPDWEMDGLVKIYEDIRKLNKNVSQKITSLEKRDTGINSLVILNNFADYVAFTIDEKLIEEVEFFIKDFY